MNKIKQFVKSDNVIFVPLAFAFIAVTLTVYYLDKLTHKTPDVLIAACEARYQEPCVVIAIPKSVNDLTDGHN